MSIPWPWRQCTSLSATVYGIVYTPALINYTPHCLYGPSHLSHTQVEQEKSKLENYTKKSLATFKDKYMAVLQTLREEKEEMQNKMRAQLEKSERNQVPLVCAPARLEAQLTPLPVGSAMYRTHGTGRSG
jgi:anion-transporting  ArsA/GET3 family ATPase